MDKKTEAKAIQIIGEIRSMIGEIRTVTWDCIASADRAIAPRRKRRATSTGLAATRTRSETTLTAEASREDRDAT